MSDRLQPAFWGGLFIGVLSALPLVSAGNCCCCLWVLSGGALAAYLRQQNSPLQIQLSEGALVGLLAGVIGGVIASVLSIPMQMVTGPWAQQMMDRLLAGNADLPQETRDLLENLRESGAMGVAGTLLQTATFLVAGAIFGTLGGLLGVAIFKKNTPPPAGTVEVLPAQ